MSGPVTSGPPAVLPQGLPKQRQQVGLVSPGTDLRMQVDQQKQKNAQVFEGGRS